MIVSREIINPLQFRIELVRQNSNKYNKMISGLTEKVSTQKYFKYY